MRSLVMILGVLAGAGCAPGTPAPSAPASARERPSSTPVEVEQPSTAAPEASKSDALPATPDLAPWESMEDPCMVGFAEALRAQRAERGEDRTWTLAGLGLRATLPSAHFVLGAADPALGYVSASFDCGFTAVKVARVGALYPGDVESARKKADLFGATKVAESKLADGFVVLGDGEQAGAEFMVFVVRTIGDREIFCEGTSRSAAGRDAMRAACESLRAGT